MNIRPITWCLCGSLLPIFSLNVSAQKPQNTRRVVVTTAPVAAAKMESSSDSSAADGSTVEQFREYLKLSGIGEQWRTVWIASVDPVWTRVAAPYWPESFKDDIKAEMKGEDLAPSVWGVYHSYYSSKTMAEINAVLREKGIDGYLAAKGGADFCAEWAKHEEQGKRGILNLTNSVIQRVYERDKPLIKALRAKYLAEHPDYKD